MKKMTVMAAAAATAATLTVGGMATAPPEMLPKAEASSAVYTTGPIFGLLDALGIDIGTLLPAEIQAVLAALGVQDIGNLPANSVDINNALNDIDFTVLSVLGRPLPGPVPGSSSASVGDPSRRRVPTRRCARARRETPGTAMTRWNPPARPTRPI